MGRRDGLIFGLSAAWAACMAPVDATALDRSLDESEHSLGQLASDQFLEGTESLAERLRCLDRPIDPPFAAHVHRVFAVRAFIGRQGDDTAAALRAAVAADPTYVWPTTILPEAHSLRDLYAESSPRSDGLPSGA